MSELSAIWSPEDARTAAAELAKHESIPAHVAPVINLQERWLPVPGYEELYHVSDQGRVRSLDRRPVDKSGRRQFFAGRILKPKINTHGYPSVGLNREAKGRTFVVHRLVLEAFVGPRPDGMETRHINGIQTDNRLENLEYGTALENAADRLAHGSYHPNRDKTRCKWGHRFSGDNLIITSRGRSCRQCRQDRHARQAAHA